MTEATPALCRDCLTLFEDTPAERCPECASPRLFAHGELPTLSLAHLDCDAFFASIEKRDNPELADKPVIVGGGRRGVVAACCYVARIYGVRSAMPMFKALERCPDAVVIRPDMDRYRAAGRRVRELMQDITPLVEPLSIDEAFLDLSGIETLHGGRPARSLARLVLDIERELGVTASIGLSYNKFLAKIASDLDKPRGFAAIGRAEALDFLAEKPVGIISGVGKAMQASLSRDGITRISHLRRYEEIDLIARYGAMGRRLYSFARGVDKRQVEPNAPTKSISAETTFDTDVADADELLSRLWPLCETVAARLKKSGLAGHGVTLKLKTRDFQTLTRSQRLQDPTRLADRLYRAAEPLLRKAADGRRFRLIGIGAHDLVDAALADPPSLLDPDIGRHAKVEAAMDRVRGKLGADAIVKGRGFKT
ncbi:DNA polymerase IV [Ferruginivarius sediminum]|uniref:DNA polymerase IV n=1 Tax=Ferruginivarius sediminum TaxID=2661937 RepID=A0A369TBT9_9PROT|nr:DNA polymerase IV [Ferruginivarius sediminum]RDD62740.1 DNA polymerase IV [Ferruginivarius sediminum]